MSYCSKMHAKAQKDVFKIQTWVEKGNRGRGVFEPAAAEAARAASPSGPWEDPEDPEDPRDPEDPEDPSADPSGDQRRAAAPLPERRRRGAARDGTENGCNKKGFFATILFRID